MINYRSNIASLRALGEQQNLAYAANQPFPHTSIDNFFDESTLDEVTAEVDAVDKAKATGSFLNKKTDHNKFTFEPEDVGVRTNRLVNFLNSGPFLAYIEKLTGISNLIADPSYFGGGLHLIENGGFLEVHADFNHLKRYNLERRINLLLYLNKDWKPEFRGELELWDSKSRTMSKDIAPIFNRCVIFSTTKESLHGHPVPLATPPGKSRRSIALYYYTNTWQPTVQDSHNTLYFISRNNEVKRKPSRVVRDFILDFIPPIVRKSARAIKRSIKGEKLTKL